MLYPSIDQLVEKVGSKYLLVVSTARRARQMREGVAPQVVNPKSKKYVGMALEEIEQGIVQIEKQSS